MNLGIGLGVTNYLRVPTVALDPDAAIAALFESGEVGAWYDPSDSTTVFQDAAEMIPATVGDPVGLILDKSQGLTLGPELVTNGTFDTDINWTKSGAWEITGGVAQSLALTNGNITQTLSETLSVGDWVKVTFTLSARTSGFLYVLVAGSGTNNNLTQYYAPGTYNALVKVSTVVDNTVGFAVGNNPIGFVIDNVSFRKLPGNHATQTTSAARPVLQQSGDLYYLDFDGVDDYMQTASVDFTSTDKMSVFAGINRKSSTLDMLVELSDNWNTNTGSFEVISGTDGSSGTGPGFHTASRGTAAVNAAQFSYTLGDFTPPVDAVLTATHDIAGDESLIRGNGTAYTPGTADKGAGNFGNYPLYICIRGSGLQYPGHYRIYGLIVRGAASTAGQISDAETYLAAKSGVTL